MSASAFTIRGKFLEGNEVVGLELFGHDVLSSHLGQQVMLAFLKLLFVNLLPSLPYEELNTMLLEMELLSIA